MQQYSLSLMAAVSQHKVVSYQVIEGGVDAVLFEHFIYRTLQSVKADPANQGKDVVLFMDNAVIHLTSSVLETIKRMGVHALFNAEYSPWLNPVEMLFAHIKKCLRQSVLINSR